MDATHLLPLSNLNLPISKTPNTLTHELTHKPISSTHLPFKYFQPNFIFESQLIQKPKIQIVDPKQKLNQHNLFYDLLSKLKKLKINYDKFAEEIIKMSTVKSKDQRANILLKAIGSKALNDIVQVRFR